MKDDSIYIDHIINSINRILDYILGKDRESFEADLVTQDAVVSSKLLVKLPRGYRKSFVR